MTAPIKLLPRFTRYSLTLLLSAVLLSDAVGATPRGTALQIAQQPGTTSQDATRAAAERVYQEGIQLYQQGTAESLRQAIGKLQEALKYYNQALPIVRAVGDRAGEAATLNNIGAVYNDLGEKQEASQFKLPANGKPFKPSDLNQSKQADEVNRGIPTGKDYCIPMTSRKYPWSTIGRVQGTTTDAKNYHCTGTLIDDDIVLTNAHCVIDSKTHQLSRWARKFTSM